MIEVKKQLEQCLAKFRAGTLTEQELERALESVNRELQTSKPCQRLLYLQASSTLVTSQVEGMSIVDSDGVHNGPDHPDEWPYQTVHEAMCDGWRILKFPEMTLMLVGENETHGLGCEFVLEK